LLGSRTNSTLTDCDQGPNGDQSYDLEVKFDSQVFLHLGLDVDDDLSVMQKLKFTVGKRHWLQFECVSEETTITTQLPETAAGAALLLVHP
jgi:hypothetical protein